LRLFIKVRTFCQRRPFFVSRPGRRKSSYATGRTKNIRDKPTLAKLTLMMMMIMMMMMMMMMMMTLTKASKR
jgi:hypothetical protein